jgi:putative FmdB family regulatory protein
MPTYEYRCKACPHEFEIVQAFTDDALTECPVCHGALRKVFGNVGISFKGSGFYKTDHGSRAKNGESKAESKSETKTDAASSSSSTSGGESSKSSSSGSSSSAPATTPA